MKKLNAIFNSEFLNLILGISSLISLVLANTEKELVFGGVLFITSVIRELGLKM